MTSTCPAGHTSAADDYCDVCGMPITAASASGPATAPPPTDVPTQAPVGQLCPNCSTENVADALFCEACGYDFTTGTMPRSAAEVPVPGPDASSGAAAPESSAPTPLSPPAGLPAPGAAATATPTISPAPAGATAAPATAGPTDAGHRAAPSTFSWVAEVWIDPAWYEVQESPDALPSAGLPSVVPLRGSSLLIGRTSKSRSIHPDIDCELDTGTSRRQAQLTTDGTRWWVEDLESANGTFVGAASEPLPEDPIAVGVKRELATDDRIYIGAWTRLVVRRATEDELASLS